MINFTLDPDYAFLKRLVAPAAHPAHLGFWCNDQGRELAPVADRDGPQPSTGCGRKVEKLS